MKRLEIYEADVARSAVEPREWRWRVRSGNGEIVATGEGYTREEDARRGFRDAAHAMFKAFEEVQEDAAA